MIDSITSQTTVAGEQKTSETKLPSPVAEIDITRDVCPMTFVRTRLALDRLSSGDVLLVRLSGEEPLRNVPRTAAEQGHTGGRGHRAVAATGLRSRRSTRALPPPG